MQIKIEEKGLLWSRWYGKIFEMYTFDRCPEGCFGQKSFLARGDAKKRELENN